MFTVAEIRIDNKVANVHFACDLHQCKGACCTLKGGRGAPLTDNEVEEIYKAFPIVKKYLPKDHRAWIEKHGSVDGFSGFYATQCVDEQACVFVHYEEGIAKCAFETAFHKNEIDWRKPLSCHLFPLRISHGWVREMRFEYLSECEPALQRGIAEKMPLHVFLKDVLIRAYGTQWYEQFVVECERRMSLVERGV